MAFRRKSLEHCSAKYEDVRRVMIFGCWIWVWLPWDMNHPVTMDDDFGLQLLFCCKTLARFTKEYFLCWGHAMSNSDEAQYRPYQGISGDHQINSYARIKAIADVGILVMTILAYLNCSSMAAINRSRARTCHRTVKQAG